MGKKDLTENIEFVKRNQDKLLHEYFNKYLLVWKKGVKGSFDTYEKAAEEGVRKYGLNENFLVYHITETKPLNFIYNAAI
ncbi:MAG: hypothetical protein GY940_28230 [bacterium]|nr:hypothetical protein [bacterium]